MRRWWTTVSLVVVLAVVANWLPQLVGEVSFYRANVWPLLRRWSEPAEQARLAASPALSDVLIEADRRLPPDAGVAFVTAGQDVDTAEYIAFHRALYYLSPRPVWWVVESAEVQSERQPRWFQASPPPNTQWLLAYQVEPPQGEKAADLGARSSLSWLGDGPAPSQERPPTMLWAGPAWPVGATLALLTLLAAGWVVLAVFERFSRLRPGGVETVVLAWVLGSILVTLGLLLGCALGLGLRTSTLVLAAMAWASCLWLRRRTRLRVAVVRGARCEVRGNPRTPNPQPRTRGLASAAVVLGLALTVLYVGLLADGRPLQVWDSWVTWGMKARLIWQADAIPAGVYADPTRAVTLLNYPLLVPLLEAWVYTWIGAPDDRLAGLVMVASYAALLGLVFSALRVRGAGVLVALLGAAYVASIWALAGLAGLAFADVPLALFALVAGIYLVRWLEGGAPATLVVAAVAGGALAWTKREGLLLLILLTLASLLASRGARRWAAPALALGGILVAGPWLAFLAWQGVADWQFVPVTPQVALENRERLTFVFGTLARWSLQPEWSFPPLWVLGLFGLGLCVVRHRGLRPLDLLPAMAAAYLIMLGVSYLFSAFVPYQTHVLASLGRLMAHVAPLVGFWLVSRWLELRPAPAPMLRGAPVDVAPFVPPDSSRDHRTPARGGLETGPNVHVRSPQRPETPRR